MCTDCSPGAENTDLWMFPRNKPKPEIGHDS